MTWAKINLVTDKDGSDTLKCSECNYKKKYFGLARPPICPKCHGTGERKKTAIYGGWFNKGDQAECSFCNIDLIKCPKEGHPNSKYWPLKKSPEEVLLVCPNGCLEDGSWTYKKRKLKRIKR